MKKVLPLFFILLFQYVIVFSQDDLTEPIRCYTVEYNEFLRQKNLKLSSLQDFEKTMAAQIQNQTEGSNGVLKGVLKIPVIVHIIHNGEAVGTGPNIAAQQVYSQIEVMNEDFRRKEGSLGYNTDPRGADTEIEFVLAEYDPQGNKLAEPGINRYKGPLPAYVLEDIDILIKPATIYDPTRYLNMWTVNFAALLLGYAQFPDPAHGLASGLGCDTGSPETDGVVMGYNAFGSRAKYPQGVYHNNYDLGRTVTHEIGHYLGLRHIWGDGGCGVDDYCGDTPLSSSASTRCPTGKTTCGSLDMFENYMDYSYDKCMNIFTKDQTLRMRTVISKSPRRRELLSSTVHLAPVALDAAIIDIISPRGESCNNNVVPEVLLRNLGQSTLTSVTINYQVNSGPVKSYTWKGSLSTSDIEVVTLPGIHSKNGSNTFTVYTSLPNGAPDERTFNDKWSDGFVISQRGEELDFVENFDGGAFPPGNKWKIENPDRCVSWSPISNIVGSDGQLTSATFLDYYKYNKAGTTDGLFIPLVNLNNTDSKLKFDIAYSGSSDSKDRIEVFVSTDCGTTFNKVYDKSGAELATKGAQSSAFYPTAAGHWRRESISLNNYRSNQVLIKFIGTNGYGNNIFIDNISVIATKKQSAGTVNPEHTEAEEANMKVSVSPNPNSGSFEVTYSTSREGKVSATLLNSNGSAVFTKQVNAQKGQNRMEVNRPGLAKGMYFLLIETPDGSFKEKVLIK